MVKSCYVYGCKKRFIKNSSVSFHKFPTDPEMRKKWIKAIKRENFIPSKDAVVCSEHFLSTDFLYLIGRRTLLKDAVPRRSRRKTSLQDVVSKNLPSTSKAFSERTENQAKIEDDRISVKVEGDSDYDCYEHTEIKEEKWKIENFVKKESTSFLSSQDFEDNYCSQIKIEVKEEASPTTTDTGLETMLEEDNDQDNSSSTIKTEHPAENLQLPAPSLQTKLPLPLTNCQLPANSVLFLIPTIQGTSSTPILLNLNKLSPVNLSNILPNPSTPRPNLNAKLPEGNQLSPSSRQPLDNKE